MDKTNSKILTVSFAIAAALIGLTLSLLITAFSGIFSFMARMSGNDAFRHGLPVVTGLIIFSILQFHPKVLTWADEIVGELRKVVWPTQKDTSAMTMVVCVMVVISGVIVSSFDMMSGFVLNMILK